MRHLITLIVLATCVQLSFAAIQVKSYYFKKNSVELTRDSHQELNDFISTLGNTNIQIVELSSYAEGSNPNSNKRLSNVRINYIIDVLGLRNQAVTINSWGNKRINVKFIPLNWDRIDVYCTVEQFTATSESKDIKDDMLSKSTTTFCPRIGFNQSAKQEEVAIHESSAHQSLILSILFKGGTSDLIKETLPSLHTLYDTLRTNPALTAHIRGHVCCDNSMRVSRRRAKAVYDFLIDKGIPADRLSYKGYSNSIPLVHPERNARDRGLNRRVDVLFSMKVTEKIGEE